MKKLNLNVLSKLLKGLLDGTMVLQAVSTGKKPGKKVAAKRGRPEKVAKKKVSRGKRGRKPLSAAEKKLRLKEKARQKRLQKFSLPSARQVFEFLYDKIDGGKLTAIASHFKVKRTQIKDMIERLAEKGDLEKLHGSFFLRKRVRKMGKKPQKAAPITERQVINYLLDNPSATLSQMASDMGEKSYQRLIRVIKVLEKTRKVVKDDKYYSLV